MSQPVRVLYVDDHPLDRELVRDAFEKQGEGFVLTEAASRQEFEHQLAAGKYDVVLSDINVLAFEGLDVIDAVHAQAPDAPIVFLTGAGSEEVATGALKRGAADYVIKNHENIHHLPSTLNAVIARARLQKERDEALAALRESEERFRTLFDKAPIGVYRTTPDGRIVLSNPALVRMLGYSSFEELARRNLESEGYHPQYHRADFKRRIEEAGEVRGLEAVWTRKDGSTVFVRENAWAIRDDQGRTLYYKGTIEDITERKRAEEALARSERDYRGLFDNAHDAVLIFRPEDEVVLEVNGRACQMYGFERSEFIGMSLEAISEDVSRGKGQIRDTLREGTKLGFESVQYRKDGTEMHIDINASVIEYQGQKVILTINRDITGRKRVEKALRESEQRFRNVFEEAPIGIYRTTPDGRIVLANPALVRMLGYSSFEELARRNLENEGYRPQYPRAEFKRWIEEAGEVRGLEAAWTRKDGSTVFVRENARAIRDNQGQTLYYEGTAEDITERKQAEEALRASEHRYHELVNHMGSGVAVYRAVDGGEDFELVDFNRAGERIDQVAREDVIGRRLTEVFPRVREFGLLGVLQHVWRTGQAEHHPVKLYEDGRISGWRENFVYRLSSGEVVAVYDDVTQRKRVEHALRESEERYRLISQTIPLVVYSALPDEHSSNLFLSGRIKELTGYSGQQFLDDPELFNRVLHPEDRERVWRMIEEHRANKVDLNVEYRIVTEDGTVNWVHDGATPVLNEAGEIVRINGYMQDITERKQTEEALRRSEERRELALRGADLGTWDRNLQAGVVTYNERWAEMLGYTLEEICPSFRSWKELIHPDDRPRVMAVLNAHLEGKTPGYESEHRLRHKSGRWIWVLDRGRVIERDATGKPLRACGTHLDITKRKQAEEELIRSETKFRLVSLAARGDYIWDWKPATNHVSRSQLFYEHFGPLAPGEDTFDYWVQRIHPDDRKRVLARAMAAVEGGEPNWTNEYRLRRADGEYAYVVDRGYAARDAQGVADRVVGAIQDITERRRAEEALRESEWLLSEMGTIARIGGWEMDMTTRTAKWTRGTYEIVGIEPGQPIPGPDDHLDYYLPEYQPLVAEAMRALVEESKPLEFEAQFRTTKGEVRWCRVLGRAVREQGVCTKVHGTVQDITERRQAEQALRDSRERYRTLVDNIDLGISLVDADYRIVMTNAWYLRVFGKLPSQFIGKKCFAEFEKRDAVCPHCPGTRAMATGEATETETEGVRDDSSCLPVRIQAFPVFGADGTPTSFIEVVEDITTRKRSEEALRESLHRREELEQIVNRSPAVAFLRRAEERWPVEYVSENMAQFGYTPADFHDRRVLFADLVHPDDLERVGEEVRRYSLEGREQFTQEYRIITAAGATRWVDDRTWVRRDSEGKITYYEGIVLDITERKRLEEQFRQAQKLEAVGRLAGGIAHDFNNILTAILGNVGFTVDALAGQLPSDGALLAGLCEAEQDAQRAARLTRQLLAFSRQQVTQSQTLDLNGVLSNLEGMLRNLLGEDVDLSLTLGENLRLVHADGGQIEQVIMNLAINARDAMPEGGKLTIKTANVTQGAEGLTGRTDTRADEPQVVLTIRDTGCGMDAKTLSHIFEPFFTTKEVGRGTGLGLATVHGIVEQAGGHITVDSEPGQGTTFKTYLPAVEAEAKQAAGPETEEVVLTGTETIILCEDHGPIRRITERFLRTAGYTVLAAANGKEALSLAAKHPGRVDLLITDVIMPDMNGKRLAETLAASNSGMRTLFISGYTADVIARHGVLDEGVEFLEKPFSRSILLRRARRILDREKAASDVS